MKLKKLVIDARMIPHTGVGRYISNVLEHMPELTNVQRVLILPSKYASKFSSITSNSVVSNTERYTINEQVSIPYTIQKNHATLFHSMNYIMPIWVPCPAVVTIYDIIRLRLPQTSYTNSEFISRFGLSRFLQMSSIALLLGLRKPLWLTQQRQNASTSYQHWIYESLDNTPNTLKLHHLYQTALTYFATKNAEVIITVSEHSKKDIVDFFGVDEKKVKVIYPGVSEFFHRVHAQDKLFEVRRKYKLPNRFALHVGLWRPHKNIQGLLRAFAKLLQSSDWIEKFSLVLVGPSDTSDDHVPRLIKELHLTNNVICTGYVSDNDLPSLYTLAEFVVVPSFYEGFGLPALEAMACGTPVIVSETSSLPEIVGNAALFINPENTMDLVEKMLTLLLNSDLRLEMSNIGRARASGFTWDKAGDETAQVYSELLSRY